MHGELVEEYRYRYVNPPFSNLLTPLLGMARQHIKSIKFSEYAITQMVDGVRCHVLCDMGGFVYSLFNTINNRQDSFLRFNESVKRIGHAKGVSGYIFEAIYDIGENIYHCFDVVRVAQNHGLLSESLFERSGLLKGLVGNIGMRELVFKAHVDISEFACLSCSEDIIFTKRISSAGCKPVSFKWRHKVTIKFTLSHPVEYDEYDLMARRIVTDAQSDYDDSGRLKLPDGIPSRIRLTLYQIPRLTRRNVVELTLTSDNTWAFVRDRPDLEYADSLREVLVSIEQSKNPLLLKEVLLQAGVGNMDCRCSTLTPTLIEPTIISISQIAILECALLGKIPTSLFLFMVGSFSSIVDLKRLSATCISMWQTCDHVRLAAPCLCFDLLPNIAKRKYFPIGLRCIDWDNMRAIVRGKTLQDPFYVMMIRAAIVGCIADANGISESFKLFSRPLMHLCSFRTQRELALLILKSSTFHSHLDDEYQIDKSLASKVLFDVR